MFFNFKFGFAKETGKATICAKKEGCAEGSRDVLHDLGKGHGFIHTRNGEREVLHHGAHHAILVRCSKIKRKIDDACKLEFDALEHVKRKNEIFKREKRGDADIDRPSLGWRSLGRSPSQRGFQSRLLLLLLWRTFVRMHLRGCVRDRSTV